jgi:hypothetical protein
MAKKWIGSVDVEVGSGGGPAVEEAIDYVVSAEYRVKIDGTSRLITALSGAPATLPDNLIAVGLIREAGTADQVHYKRGGAASATTPQWAASGIAKYPVTAAAARTFQFVSAGGDIWATLLIVTPRA